MSAYRDALARAVRWAREQSRDHRAQSRGFPESLPNEYADNYDILATAGEQVLHDPAASTQKYGYSPMAVPEDWRYGAQQHWDTWGEAKGDKAMTIDRKALEETLAHYSAPRHLYADCLQTILAAAEAHLATLPKTKMVEVWHVEYAHYGRPNIVIELLEAAALSRCAQIVKDGCECVRVTGPHLHEVPE